MLLLVFRITASTLVAHSYYPDFKMGEASKWNCLPPNTPTKEGHAQIKNQETTSSCLEYMVSTLESLCWTPLSHILICSHPACPVRARHSLKQLRMAQNLKRGGGGGGGVGGGAAPPPPPFANRMLTERLLDGMSIDGTPFVEAGWHGLKGLEKLDEGKTCPYTACCPVNYSHGFEAQPPRPICEHIP